MAEWDAVRALRAGLLLATFTGTSVLTGCSAFTPPDTNVADGGFVDGTFSGRSEADDDGSYGEVTLTIAGNDITDVTFVLREADGTAKDETYGMTNGQIVNEESYRRAQAGIAAAPEYAAALTEADDLAAVDAVTGASLSYQQFVAAVEDALSNARA